VVGVGVGGLEVAGLVVVAGVEVGMVVAVAWVVVGLVALVVAAWGALVVAA
jgi:hypothetical protein